MSFKRILDSFATNQTDHEFLKLITWVKGNGLSNEEVAMLTNALAFSGETISLLKGSISVDIPSTGGPSSLSTILCPLFLFELGAIIPKLGVPGRPAGGIDILAQIPNYKYYFTKKGIEDKLINTRYLHFLGASVFAPLDYEFFKFRQKNHAQAIPEFVISSILSKKLALDIKKVGLEIRVSEHGNFGINLEKANFNAIRFIEVAKLLGIQAVCFLTDGNFPYQPFIGRGEALIALHSIFSNDVNPLLEEHIDMCFRFSTLTIENTTTSKPSKGILEKSFYKNLVAQGASEHSFLEKVNSINAQTKVELVAECSGYIKWDLGKLREIIIECQKRASGVFPDPLGITIIKTSGDNVQKGDLLAIVRIENNDFNTYALSVMSCIDYENYKSYPFKYEVIRGA